jgi:opacity protein-like surface antigen
MRLLSFFTVFFLTGIQLFGQFEQKLSLNLSAGVFNTIGPSDYLPEDASHSEAYEPALMANFRPGFSFSAGIQYNLSRHLSIEVVFGMAASNYWYFDYSDDNSEPFNYLYYEIYTDTVNYIVQTDGENELYLTTLYFGLAPRYYFRPGKKLNPYLLAGFNITNLDVHFQNNEYKAYAELGREDEYETNPAEQWHDYSTDMGFYTGTGAEYVLGDNLGLFLQARYHFVFLNEYDFTEQPNYLNYNSLELHLGARFSFLKSKDL